MRRAILLAVSGAVIVGGGFLVQFLLEPSQDLKKKMYWAMREGDLSKIKGLIAENPRLVEARYDDRAPLATACGLYPPVDNRNEVVRILLEAGADPNVDAPRCLSGAIYSADVGCVQLLLKHGADPLVKGKDGRTALEDAKYRDVQPIPQIIQEHVDQKRGK